ncbi:hypothetical protein FN846DRAFT_779701 [Sphaerosporella brunnea]|uniref:histidine kinase n=1 Tax=Sphaerosporella brunnea TaxID=1250544 RepID=A0A5J5EUY9_9PEZI|nr:hypothetical protein FN846DRAFT_779701 [Sphaerosporella brunnea]
MTVREAFLPDGHHGNKRPHIIGTAPPQSPGCSTRVMPTAKPRTQSDLVKILTVFSSVVAVLDCAHRSGVTHNNINTFSILVTRASNSAGIHGKLGGWHLASRLERQELGRGAGGAMLRGENPAPLQYIAPECTGRMNRSVDYRADFYSLGIALYELVVGFLPFRSAEPLELIHMHIAQLPRPPSEVNASIPLAISDVVMKLLQKNAEDRYQTASGLKADLDLICRLLSEGKSLKGVHIGELDTTSQFVITEKLYGREEPVAKLHEAYNSCVSDGGCVLVTVRGGSGIGKSRLVNEIQRPVVENKGFFTASKFDQYKRDFSFFTLVQTLQDLIRQVLSEPPQSLARWRTETIRAFDGDAAVLIDLIPELKLLLGPDFKVEPLANLGPVERESRFRDAFGRLLAIFGRKGVVIFLDDLHWCSQSEFMLIANIAEEANRKMRDWEYSIFILCAFRDSEVDEDHPLLAMLQYMRDLSVRVVDLYLEPLSQDSVRRIIGDTLHRDPDSKRVREDPEMQTLVELVYAKTQGNPFFVVQLLKSLHRGGYITFDFRENQWRFNLTSIEASDLPPTVVDLLVKQMLKLSDNTRAAMMLASCIGTERISLRTLATAAGKRVEQMASDIWGALDAGLILPTGGNYKIHLALEGTEMNDENDEAPSPVLSEDRPRTAGLGISNPDDDDATYRFLHDRVQQAAYSLIPAGQQAGLHRMIGMRMLAKASEDDLNEGLVYEIVNQLNHYTAPLDPEDRRVLMELNLRAGKKALQATAFATALNYFLIAKRVLSDAEKNDDSERDRTLEELGIEIKISLMEGYFADVKYVKSIKMAEEILPMCTESKDKVRCLICKMNCLLVQGKLNEAIEAGLTGLGILSWEVPLEDEEAEKHAQMMRPRILLEIKEIKAIAKRPEMKDENLLLLQEIISTLLLPIYMSRPSLLPAVCYTSVAITLECGISMAGAYPLLMTGVILGSEATHDNLARSYAYGQLAIKLIENSHTRHPLAPAIYQVYAGHIGVFHQSMNDVLRCLQQAVQTGLSVFNVDYTTFAMVELTSFGMMSGENLASVQSKMVAAKPSIRRFKQETGMWWLNLPMQFLLNLRGQGNSDPLCFEGEALGNSKDLARLAASESLSHIYMYHMYRLIIAAMYGYWELTADLAVHCCQPLASAMTGTFYAGLTAFYSSVALLTLHRNLSEDQRDLLNQNIACIKEWGTRARATWMHKSVCLKAEMMRISDETQQLKILDLYDHAIALANKSGFVHDAAFINERCGTWLHDISKKRATPYLQESFRCYNTWGATHKAGELRKQFPDELMLMRDNRPPIFRNPSESAALVPQSPKQSPRASRITMEPRDYGFEPYAVTSGSLYGSGAGMRDLFAASDAQEDEVASHSSSARNNDSSLGSELDFRTVLKASLVISEGMHLEDVIVSLMKSVLQTAGADYGVLILQEDGNLFAETVGLLDDVNILEHEPLNTRPDLVPISVVNIVANLGEQILRNGDDPKFELTYGRDLYFRGKNPKSVLAMPIQNQLKTMGVLYLENKLLAHAFTRQRQELLNLLCTQAAVTIDKARLYRQMELAKKAAEEATEEKSTFLANMSHEIRTPFNALLSCSIFLMDTALTEQQKEYVENIRNSAVLTLQIIDGILDFSKLEYGQFDLQKSPFSLRDCVEGALLLVAEPAATKDLELAYHNKCSNIEFIIGDITRFRQCIINLIGNAVKFTQEGYILVTSQAQQLPDDSKWRIQVSVQDTGIGIPESAFSRLFRAFSQVDTSTRRTYGGTGLGLAISKKLAQIMGGDIWFESEEGKGTTFHFAIVAEVIQKEWHPDPRIQGKKAIVADVHKISSHILANELEVEGMVITRTSDYNSTLEALHAAGKGHFEVALIDLSVDGTYAIFDKFQEFDPNCKVILMSRFGTTIPAHVLNKKCTLSFLRPAPRNRYVSAVHDALNPHMKKQEVAIKPELEVLRTLSTRHPLNILLAEDNPLNTRVALQHLKRMGYSAQHAKDGIEVLELCEAAAAKGEMFDVILMDIQMPRADGIETSLELGRRYADHERPTIIALTANATASDREKCHDAGMRTHIAKPILPNDLATALMSTTPLQRGEAAGAA